MMVSARAGQASLAGNVFLLPVVFFECITVHATPKSLKYIRIKYVFMVDVQADVRFPHEFVEDV